MTKNFIFDTNILVHIVRNEDFFFNFEKKYDLAKANKIISVVTEGEILSLSAQFKWGNRKKQRLLSVLSNLIIYPIKVQSIIKAYAQIDAYSQGKLIDKPLPNKLSARNMGKNDLWIAATAHVTNSMLITTDKDFDHLRQSFIDLDRITSQDFL